MGVLGCGLLTDGHWLAALAARWLADGSASASCPRTRAWRYRGLVEPALPDSPDTREHREPPSCQPGRAMLRLSRWGLRRAPEPAPPAPGGPPTVERRSYAGGDATARRAWPFMRTARRAALALGFAALALVALPAAAQEDVPLSWILAPDGVDRGDTFRLMFVTSSKRAGNSDSIGNYNSIVRTDAGDGHPGIYEFRDDFNAVASTESTDARDNTDTNPNSDGAGEPIYWLGGAKVADNYADFYDGSGTATPGSVPVQGRDRDLQRVDGHCEQREPDQLRRFGRRRSLGHRDVQAAGGERERGRGGDRRAERHLRRRDDRPVG